MKRIPLTQGLFAKIDDADFAAVSAFKWCADRSKSGSIYAKRRFVKPDGSATTQYMHRFILPGAICVDHINGNGLDNRRSNLRRADRSINGLNRIRPEAGNDSGTCGVSRHSSGVGWIARVCFRGFKSGKYFLNKRDAGAYAKKERARLLSS